MQDTATEWLLEIVRTQTERLILDGVFADTLGDKCGHRCTCGIGNVPP